MPGIWTSSQDIWGSVSRLAWAGGSPRVKWHHNMHAHAPTHTHTQQGRLYTPLPRGGTWVQVHPSFLTQQARGR